MTSARNPPRRLRRKHGENDAPSEAIGLARSGDQLSSILTRSSYGAHDLKSRQFVVVEPRTPNIGSASTLRRPRSTSWSPPLGRAATPFRHALRISELVGLRWQQIHLDTATIHITRAKNGTPGNHGLQGDELRLLRALRREHPHSDFVFLSERKAPLSVDGAQKLIERLGEAAKLPFPIHAHMRDMLLATPWRLVGSIQGRCKPSWGIARSRTRLSTRR